MAEMEAVTMADGSVVNFAGKKKMVKSSSVVDGAVVISLAFRNGEQRVVTIPADLTLRFACFGADQKFGDNIAGLTDIDDCVVETDALIANVVKGQWGATREGGNGMAGVSILMKALVEKTGKTVEAIKEFLAGKTQGEKLALRNNPAIKPIVDRLEGEKASKKGVVDTDALLAELA